MGTSPHTPKVAAGSACRATVVHAHRAIERAPHPSLGGRLMSVLRDSGERENRNRGVERVGAHPTSAQKKTSEPMGDDGDLTVELTVEPEVGMELCLEKLKMLRYERDFLTSRRPPWPPCTRTPRRSVR